MLAGISRMLGLSPQQHHPTTFVHFKEDGFIPDYAARSTLPSVMVQRGQVSIWSILKQSVGKELSKVTMPVVFNEPLSFLQRLCEYLEYYETLKLAAHEQDPLKRIQLVAAFAVSALASNWERVGKPFNPLLGETYQLDRLDDLGFRWVSEQVSHHPPISAFYAHGPDFKFYGTIYPKLRFWGRSVEIQPKGVVTLELTEVGDVYTWSNVSCSVHNLVMGTPIIEQHGSMQIVSHVSKLSCTLNFKASNAWLNRDCAGHHIEGFVVDDKGHRLKALYGVWTNFLASVDVAAFEQHFPNWGRERKARSSRVDGLHQTQSAPSAADCDGEEGQTRVVLPVLAGSRVLWRVRPRPAGNDRYYHFTAFAMMLNEPSPARHHLPPTDSRLRPDIECLERADLDGAAAVKNRLEEKQREAQAKRKKAKTEWRPRWFQLDKHPYVCEESWLFTNEYWSRQWTKCPDIF